MKNNYLRGFLMGFIFGILFITHTSTNLNATNGESTYERGSVKWLPVYVKVVD